MRASRIFPRSWVRRVLLGVPLALTIVALGYPRLTAPDPTVLLRDRHGRTLAEIGGGGEDADLGYWPVEGLPPRVVAATLALEDRRFWRHPGVDPAALARAVRQNWREGRRASGASTIAMQVVRMERPAERTYARKALEAIWALAITARYGRQAVLGQYLKIAPYGNRIRGIAYAARRYFDKPVEDLSWAEVAFLTALPKAPGRMNPWLPGGLWRAKARGQEILRRLRAQNAIPVEDWELARRQLDRLWVPPEEGRPESALHALLRIEERLADPTARRALGPSPIVPTTIDIGLQNEVANLTAQTVRSLEERGAGNAALIVLDRTTNEVLAYVGSTGYFDERSAGAIDYARIARSSGSTLKPFLYALALERGVITPATVLDDLHRGAGGIGNADESFLGPLLPRVALANSRNVPAADLLARVGLDSGYGFLGELGLHDRREPARSFGLGLAIGGLPVDLEDLVRAYTALARDGVLGDLVWFRDGPRAGGRRVLSEETVRLVTLFLADPMARLPAFPRLGASEYRFPVAVKTGTSSAYRDAWAVAYSTRYVVGAWIGHPSGRSMNRLTGHNSAALLVQRVMNSLHADQQEGLQDLSFPPPEGYRQVRLCALSGQAATAACDRTLVEWFRPGEEPVEPCAVHVRLAVDRATGRIASAATPPGDAELRTFVRPSARYAAWAAAAGLPLLPTVLQDGAAPAGAAASGPGQPGARYAVDVKVVSPEAGLTLLADPETPAELASILLQAEVNPPAPEIVWYVDGEPFRTADYPYSTRWPLRPGEHTFQARLPHGNLASTPVQVTVQ